MEKTEKCVTAFRFVMALVFSGTISIVTACGTKVTPPQSPPPLTLHSLSLTEPKGGTGNALMIKQLHVIPYIGGYTTRSVYYAEGHIALRDQLGEWDFGYERLDLERADMFRTDTPYGLHGLTIRFLNRSKETVEIDWNRSALVDASGTSLRIIHRGIPYQQRTSLVPPSIIPPGANLNDFVFPSDPIRFEFNAWRAPPFFEALEYGHRFSLSLALRVGQSETRQTFAFLASQR